MTPFIWAYVTHDNKEKALEMAKTLVKEKVIACANLFDQVTSIYEWEGKLCQENEVIIIMKTKEELYDKLKARVEELHPYSCPCIVALPILKGNEAYLSWLDKQTI